MAAVAAADSAAEATAEAAVAAATKGAASATKGAGATWERGGTSVCDVIVWYYLLEEARIVLFQVLRSFLRLRT